MAESTAADSVSSSYICEFCLDTVCSSTRSWDYHHPDFLSLKKSAAEQCTFCTTLLDDVLAKFSTTDAKLLLNQNWPLHRWNLRRQAYLRECQQVIVLTFRAIVPSIPMEMVALCESLPDRTFHFYPKNDIGSLPSITDLGSSTNGEQSWRQIHQWMDTCIDNHERCRRKRQNPESIPTRLLDLAEVDPEGHDHGHIRVVETSAMKVKRPYMTLSHYWGKNPKFLELNSGNLNEFTSFGIDWNNPDLPQNFKDAMIITRKLRIRYIWIDSLCIVQRNKSDASDTGEDFKHEGFLMHKYYRNSFCNICAGDSDTNEPGLFRNRDLTSGKAVYTSRVIPATYTPRPGNKLFGSDTWRVIPDSLWNERLLSNILYFRAWVFQERMLAPRILHFSKHQIFWECSSLSACEGLPSGIPQSSDVTARTDRRWRLQLQSDLSLKHRPLAGEEDASMETLWKNAVRGYTSCSITRDTDKLKAIWSVAKLVGDALQEPYAVGLWADRLEEQLAWRVVDCRQADGQLSKRLEIDGVPSWSWASIRGVIELQDRYSGSGPLKRVYRVVDHDGSNVKFHLDGSPPLAEDTEGLDEPRTLTDLAIRIRGHLRQGQIVHSANNRGWSLSVKRQNQSSEDQAASHDAFIVLSEAFPDVNPEQVAQPLSCWFVVLAYSLSLDNDELFSGIGLLLEAQSMNMFRRIGAFQFNNITAEELGFLVATPVHFERTSLLDQKPDQTRTSHVQATNFYLV